MERKTSLFPRNQVSQLVPAVSWSRFLPAAPHQTKRKPEVDLWEYKKATDVAIDYYAMCNVRHPHVRPRGVPSVVLSPPLACEAPLTDRCGFDVGLGSLVDVCESGTAHEQPPGVTRGRRLASTRRTPTQRPKMLVLRIQWPPTLMLQCSHIITRKFSEAIVLRRSQAMLLQRP